LLIKYSQIYANTDVLSPIDRDTWRIIGETANLRPSSRAIELASGKGGFARFLAERFGCRVNGFDSNPEFVEYSIRRAAEQGLSSLVDFRCHDVNSLRVGAHEYDLGVCLGALYLFREAGWNIFRKAVKRQGYLAISDIFCKKVPAPKAVMDVFFEEEGHPLTLQDLRGWYIEHGFNILVEEECSRKAWLEYYDRTRETLQALAKEHALNGDVQREIAEANREDTLVRKYGEEFVGYMTFILKRP
jgi:cyclopropane fatty-acyl-phospholipid synthase-like methyltransferase